MYVYFIDDVWLFVYLNFVYLYVYLIMNIFLILGLDEYKYVTKNIQVLMDYN